MAPDHVTPLRQPESAVSIIILAYNQLSLALQCLESVQRYTILPHQIIVVDNGSTDGTGEALRERQAAWRAVRRDGKPGSAACLDFKVIRHEENLGFAAGNNAGLAVADSPYVLLLNNDVVVTRGWLEPMLQCARWEPAIGIVGPMTNDASGPQMIPQVGYDAATLEGLEQYAALWQGTHRVECVKYWRLAGFCMLIDRRVIDAIGGLDWRYGLGNFGDDDYCIRAAIAGFESAIARGAFVHRIGNRTFAEKGIDDHLQLSVNWEVFKSKWGLPAELPYGAAYDLECILRQPFDPTRHWVNPLLSARAA